MVHLPGSALEGALDYALTTLGANPKLGQEIAGTLQVDPAHRGEAAKHAVDVALHAAPVLDALVSLDQGVREDGAVRG